MNIIRYRNSSGVSQTFTLRSRERDNKDISFKDKILNGGGSINTTLERPCTVLKSIEDSLNEVQLIRQGKLPKKTWKQLKQELKRQ